MKNLFLGAIALTTFAISFALVQVSCSKTKAQTTSGNLVQLDKIIFIKRDPTTSNQPQIWTANYDGSSLMQVPIVLPADVYISYDINTVSVKLSPDGQTVFFSGVDANTNKHGIYSCKIDGSSVAKIAEGATNELVRLGGAY